MSPDIGIKSCLMFPKFLKLNHTKFVQAFNAVRSVTNLIKSIVLTQLGSISH